MKIGIIGCGKQAAKHIAGLNDHGVTDIVLADQDAKRAEALGRMKSLPFVGDVDCLFDDREINTIIIATPTPTHAALIRRAMEARKHFFCEKPLCETLDEALELVPLFEGTDLTGMVGYVYRFAPAFDAARRLLGDAARTGRSDVLGRIVTAWFRIGGRGSHQLWKHRVDSGGGAINEMLVHMVDLAIWFFGDVREVEVLRADLLRPRRQFADSEVEVDAEDFVVVRLGMAAGFDAYLQADLVTPAFSQIVEIQGENGSFRGSIEPDLPTTVFCVDPIAGFPSGRTTLATNAANLFSAQIGEFIAAVRSARQPAKCTLRDSLAILEAIDRLGRARPSSPASRIQETRRHGRGESA